MVTRKRFDALGFRARILLFVFLPLLALTTTIGIFVFSQLEEWVEERMQEDVELVARSLRLPISNAIERERPGSLQHSLETTLEFSRLYGASVFDAEGKILATAGDLTRTKDLTPDPVDLLAQSTRTGSYGEANGRSLFSYFVPLRDSTGATIGLLQVARLRRDMLESVQRLRGLSMAFFTGVSALVAAFVLAGYHGAVGRSLGALATTMAEVKSGQRRRRAQVTGPREIAGLAVGFNQMLDSIARAEEEILKRQRNEIRLQQDLQKQERLAGLGQVAAGIAHELGTPLGVVDGKAQRLLRRPDLSDAERAEMQIIRSEVQRMVDIVRQLLEFGRSHDAQKRSISVGFLVRNSVRRVEEQRLAGEHEIVIDPENEDVRITVNPLRAELAVGNLLKNALIAKSGGRVEVQCTLGTGVAEIRIRDHGRGIPDEVKARMFEPFVTTRSAHAGTGLGLAIAQQVATESGGAIRAENLEAGGALFVLSLPLTS